MRYVDQGRRRRLLVFVMFLRGKKVPEILGWVGMNRGDCG